MSQSPRNPLRVAIHSLSKIPTKMIGLANYDFCPNLNRYVYWLRKPIVCVVTAIVFSLLVGLLVGPQGYVIAFALLALLVLGLAWPWLSMKGVRCYLEFPEGRLWENQEVDMVFRVQNFWPLPIFGMMVEGEFLQDLEEGEERIAFSFRRVPAWCETEFSIPITPRQRGMLPSGEVRIMNGFPFGLLDVSKPVTSTRRSLVWPACESLDGHPPAEGTQLNVLGALKDQSGNDGETIGVRVFREGDRLRNIHWAQTVRSQRLMVRERQSLCSTSATVLVDLTPEHHVGHGVHSSFEWAVRIAGTVCYQLHTARSPVRLQCVGIDQQSLQTTDNHYGIKKLMDYLAELPTLAKLRDEIDLAVSDSEQKPLKFVGRTFFVGTTRSRMRTRLPDNVQPIVIQLNGFTGDEENALDLETNPFESNHKATTFPTGMLVTEPHLAASQLGHGWRRSFSGAAG